MSFHHGYGQCECGNWATHRHAHTPRCERCAKIESTYETGHKRGESNYRKRIERAAKMAHENVSFATLKAINAACDLFFDKRGMRREEFNRCAGI